MTLFADSGSRVDRPSPQVGSTKRLKFTSWQIKIIVTPYSLVDMYRHFRRRQQGLPKCPHTRTHICTTAQHVISQMTGDLHSHRLSQRNSFVLSPCTCLSSSDRQVNTDRPTVCQYTRICNYSTMNRTNVPTLIWLAPLMFPPRTFARSPVTIRCQE